MSMNLQVISFGEVITPSGKKMKYQDEFPLIQTRTVDTYQIMGSENKYEAYKSLYGDRGDRLKKWLIRQEKYGYTIEWNVI